MKLLIKLLLKSGTFTPAFWLTIASPVNATIADDRGYSVVNAAVGGSITPSFTMTRTTGVAPLGVHFDASATTAATLTSLPFHELHYAWSFGDPAGGATWAYGTQPGVASKNTAYGPIAAHVFETPGTYTVTLWVYHIDAAGTLTSASVAGSSSITVTNPDTVFAGATTLCVSNTALPVAGVGGVPAGATCELLTSWNLLSTRAQTYKRILLKRGDVWATDGMVALTSSSPGPGIIGAYGSGNQPRISIAVDQSALRFYANANDWRVMDLEITSDEVAYKPNGDCITVSANNILVLRSTVKLGRILLNGLGGSAGYYIVDCAIGPNSTLGYGICGYLDKSDNVAMLGNRITGSRDHGFRLQGTANSVISHNHIDAPSAGGHVFTLRGKANDADYAIWTGTWSEKNVVSDNLFDGSMGSGAVIKVAPQNNESAERLRDIIVERNIMKAANVSAATVSVAYGFSFRNNLLISRGPFGMDTGGGSTAGSPNPTSAFIYSNTFYKPDTALFNGYSVIALSGTYSGIELKNNLAYAPGNTRNGATNGTTATFAQPNTGTINVNYTLTNNSSDAQVHAVKPWAATTPVNAIDFTPASSYAVDDGTYVPIRTDFFNANIAGTRDIGAIQA